MARKFFVGGNFKMNPASQAQKKTIVKVLNEADLDPNVGMCALLQQYGWYAHSPLQRSSLHLRLSTFFP